MSKDILSALEEQFNQECLAINVKEEYPDYLGTEQWIIITDLSDEELTARYEDLINRYYPYIKLVRQLLYIAAMRTSIERERSSMKVFCLTATEKMKSTAILHRWISYHSL